MIIFELRNIQKEIVFWFTNILTLASINPKFLLDFLYYLNLNFKEEKKCCASAGHKTKYSYYHFPIILLQNIEENVLGARAIGFSECKQEGSPPPFFRKDLSFEVVIECLLGNT